MQVLNRYEDMTADMRAEVEEVAAGLGVKAVRCSMGETDTDDGYAGWDGQHPLLSNGVGEGILYTTTHGALYAALLLLRSLIP